jgi:hypothetical protein
VARAHLTVVAILPCYVPFLPFAWTGAAHPFDRGWHIQRGHATDDRVGDLAGAAHAGTPGRPLRRVRRVVLFLSPWHLASHGQVLAQLAHMAAVVLGTGTARDQGTQLIACRKFGVLNMGPKWSSDRLPGRPIRRGGRTRPGSVSLMLRQPRPLPPRARAGSRRCMGSSRRSARQVRLVRHRTPCRRDDRKPNAVQPFPVTARDAQVAK